MSKHVAKIGQLAGVLRRIPVNEQRNMIAAMRSIYCCQVREYSLSLYESTLEKMAPAEQAIVIEYVRRLWS
jgi:hypothetical protein